MSSTVTGVLGQLNPHGGEVLGVFCPDEGDSALFIHVPVDVVDAVEADLLVQGNTVTLTGHKCDHEIYFVVTRVEACP